MTRVAHRRVLLVSVVALAGAGCVVWLLFQHIPSWYEPRWLSANDVQRIQNQLEETFEIISQKMIEGEPFSISFSADHLNNFLAAQPRIWPQASKRLPRGLRHPCVSVEPHHVRFGMRYRHEDIYTVLSVALIPAVQDEYIDVHIDAARAGSLPIASRLLVETLNRRLRAVYSSRHSATAHADTLAASGQIHVEDDGHCRIANAFEWPNGEVPFSISSLSLDAGLITIEIDPQP